MTRQIRIPVLDAAHGRLSARVHAYGQWHRAPFASAVHWTALFVYAGMVALAFSSIVARSVPAHAETNGIDFESGYVPGNIDGQHGWTNAGPFDAAVVPNTYGYLGFGTTSFRMSNAVTSTSFSNQPFSPPLAEEAGETTAWSPAATPVRHATFFTQFDVASTVPGAEQPGLVVRISPDGGGGIRMGWLEVADTPAGLSINAQDFHDLPPYGSVGTPSDGCGTGGDTFTVTNVVSGLDRTVPHRVGIAMALADGPMNDVFRVYVDGVLKFTGTDWEDYHRWCEGAPGTPGYESRTVATLLFRASGTAAPATAGNGFLFDNFTIASGSLPKAITSFTANGSAGTVNESAHTVAVTVPYGTDRAALAPTVLFSGSSVSPASGVAVDFTAPQTYVVTAADGTTQSYLVTVTAAPAPMATLHVATAVNGGTAGAGDATVHVRQAGADVPSSPAPGAVSPGSSYSLAAGAYTVSVDDLAGYVGTVGGDCAADGTVTLGAGSEYTCLVTETARPATAVAAAPRKTSAPPADAAPSPAPSDGSPVPSSDRTLGIDGQSAQSVPTLATTAVLQFTVQFLVLFLLLLACLVQLWRTLDDDGFDVTTDYQPGSGPRRGGRPAVRKRRAQ